MSKEEQFFYAAAKISVMLWSEKFQLIGGHFMEINALLMDANDNIVVCDELPPTYVCGFLGTCSQF